MVDMNSARPIQALTEAERAAITQSFRQEPIRVVIYTYKIDDEVPEHIRTHLYRNYAPLWANVWIYAPQLTPADTDVHLLFADLYTIETEEPHIVRIDGQA